MTDPLDTESQRKKIIAKRNLAVALLLAGLVVLFFAITLVQFQPHLNG